MAYNLYQAQMAKAWAQRIEKEQLIADRFWSRHTTEQMSRDSEPEQFSRRNLKDIETCSSIAPTYVSDLESNSPTTEVTYTSFVQSSNEQLLKDRLERLERELLNERQRRLEIQEDLNQLKVASQNKSSTSE